MDINILKELGFPGLAAYVAYLILKAYSEQTIKQNNIFISNLMETNKGLMDTNKALLETNKQISKANREGLEKVTDELKLMREDINQLKSK